MTGRRLPELIDRAGIVAELGVTDHVAEKMMRDLPKITVKGVRKVWVRRADVQRLLDEGTRAA